MIVFLCPKPASPSGGVWFINRLSCLARNAGMDARVLVTEPFTVWWDANPPQNLMTHSGALEINELDTVVVPEVLWPRRNGDFPRRRIVFIQNHIWTSKDPLDYVGADIVTCSRYLDNWCRRVLGIAPVGMWTPYLDDGPWRPTVKLPNRVLLLGRRTEHAPVVRDALVAAGYAVDYATGALSQRELSDRLGDAEYYVHLASPEGWPMACAEAMASGTLVVGTTGGGGNEFMFHGETAMTVQDPETGRYSGSDEFARRVVEQIDILRSDANMRSRIWTTAHAWVQRYTAARTTEQLMAVLR